MEEKFKEIRQSLLLFTPNTIYDHDFSDPLLPVWRMPGGSQRMDLSFAYAKANAYERAKLLLLDLYRRIRFVDKELYVFIGKLVMEAFPKHVPEEFSGWTHSAQPLVVDRKARNTPQEFSRQLAEEILKPYEFIKEVDGEIYTILANAIQDQFDTVFISCKAEHGELSEAEIVEVIEDYWFEKPFNREQINDALKCLKQTRRNTKFISR